MIPAGFERFSPELVSTLVSYIETKQQRCLFFPKQSLDKAMCDFRQTFHSPVEQGLLLDGKPTIGNSANGIIIDTGVAQFGEHTLPVIVKYSKKNDSDFFYEVVVNIILINELISRGIQGLVPSYGFFLCSIDPETKQYCTSTKEQGLFLATHKLNGMTLYDYIMKYGATMTIPKIQEIVSNLFTILIQLEESEYHIIHNDLHIWNIMMQHDTPYLIDFGACSFQYNSLQYTLCDWVRSYTGITKVSATLDSFGGSFDIIKVISKIIQLCSELKNNLVATYLGDKQDAILSHFSLVPYEPTFFATQGIELYKWLLRSKRVQTVSLTMHNTSQLTYFTYRRIKELFFTELPAVKTLATQQWIPTTSTDTATVPLTEEVKQFLIDPYRFLTSSTPLPPINKVKDHLDDTTIVIFTGLFSDGSGDFSFISNLITLILDSGIPKEHIHVIIIPMIENAITSLKNMKKELDTCTTTSSSLSSPTTEVGDQVYKLVYEFFIYICTIYKNLFSSGELCEETMTLTINDIKRRLQEFLYRKQLYDLTNNHNCAFTEKTITNFITFTLSNHVLQWLQNCTSFFFTKPLIPIEHFHIQLADQKLTTSMVAIDTKYVATIRFLNIDKYIDPSWERFTSIKLEEGGICNDITYSPGFSTNQLSKCIGITVIDVNLITEKIKREDKTPYLDGNYMVCYFGNLQLSFVSSYNLLFYFKVKFICQFMKDVYPTALICINKVAFNVLQMPDAKKVCTDLVVVDDRTIMIQDMKITFFDPKPREDFLVYLYQSLPVCLLTGDQSYFEGISMGKLVFYDLLGHKVTLAKQMLSLYQSILPSNTSNSSNPKSNSSDEIIKQTAISMKLYYQNKPLYKVPAISYQCNEKFFIYEINGYNTVIYYSKIKEYYDLTFTICVPLLDDRIRSTFITTIQKYSFTSHLRNIILEKEVVQLGKKKRIQKVNKIKVKKSKIRKLQKNKRSNKKSNKK